VDASKDSKCYATVNFGFGQASAKSKSIGIDCIQSFEGDIEEGEDNKKKKQKKTTTDNNNNNNTKKKKEDSIINAPKRRQILVAKSASSEVSVVDFSDGFDQAKIETTFRVEDAIAWKTQNPTLPRRRRKRTGKEPYRLVYPTMARSSPVVTVPEMVSSTSTI